MQYTWIELPDHLICPRLAPKLWSAILPSTSMLDDVKKAVGITSADSSTASVSDKRLFADIFSVLAMTYSDSGKRETLR
ncbi:BQ5605_C020g09130 [Microbotryum silenes-dioicae]|uniref:BQ5605_C020g09130 protein n=1 Tax=Microbotryum silenes-dioicae TaxID=796604 RepID=A0A2X0PDQ6_9BASI|nr:BQ5605_C020g09130 [Microbotryum silenes-dioicae]